MNLYRRFIAWLARDEIATAKNSAAAELIALQKEATAIRESLVQTVMVEAQKAAQTGYQHGYAMGEGAGRYQAFSEVERIAQERLGIEVIPEDIERARKIFFH